MKKARTQKLALPATRSAWGLACLLAVVLVVDARAATRVKDLDPRHQQWLEDVELILTKEESKAFLEIEKDYQRDAFVRRFWESRDPSPGTEENEFKDRYYVRLADARREFKHPQDDRRRIYLLHGEPGEVQEVDCGLLLWPMHIWRYGYSELIGGSLTVIFTQRGGGGPFRIWRPSDGYQALFGLGGSNQQGTFYGILNEHCAEMYDTVQELIATLQIYESGHPMGPVFAEQPPPANDPEWLRTFHAFSTDAVAGAPALGGELDWHFPGRRGQRTVVAGRLLVPASEASAEQIGDSSSYSFLLTGEVLREQELFESFRYRFDVPARSSAGERIDLLFERYLRPGAYQVVLKVEDIHGGGVFREIVDLEVPRAADGDEAESTAASEELSGPETFEEARIELIAQETELQSGKRRFLANVSGSDVAKVSFLLNDKPVLTKTRPPYSVELDLGDLPVTHTVRALALDRSGAEIATDELLLNAGEHTFLVRLVEPRQGERYQGVVKARADVRAPEGRDVERVEFFLGDTRVATLFQPPYIQQVPLEHEDLAFIRVVAYLADGNSSDDLVVFNTAQFIEDVSVRMVELFATVVDAQGRPIEGLEQEQFTVTDNGEPQSILRFERLDDLPIYASLLLDTSASMAESLEEVRRVALGFLQETITPRDRACVITFSEKPRLAAAFTNDLTRLGGGLAGLTAERSTALYDSLMFGLYYFKGIKGQRALIVLSDGEDRKSESTFEEVLDFARSSGVTIYTIGFKLGKGGRISRNRLEQMAEETGGQAFFVQSAAELGVIYEAIQKDLRSRYLLAYQPALDGATGFRRVTVKVAVAGAEVRAMNGYLP